MSTILFSKEHKIAADLRFEGDGTIVTKEEVIEVLKSCYDPEIPINIIDLGLVYGIEIKEDRVHIKMTLTSRGCPMGELIAENVKRKVEAIKGVKEAEVELVWDPPWTPDRISEDIMKKITK
ncbi:metal-sulfur cluster assembly factor [Methanosarcina sp. T3]|uniref:metal-sulfur cluster assembly factor n=1 Tax=Methanosarcina sp. T3 TaxID=3439062 RepID=UPI003F8392BE